MSPTEKGIAFMADLARRIRLNLQAAEEQARLVSEPLERADQPPDVARMALVSVAMDRAYTALEAAFARVARELDQAMPAGEGWHAALLHQMTLAIQDRRPPLLTAAAAAQLDRLRAHRHWLRHAYTANFDWSSMAETARSFPGAIAVAQCELEGFLAFLEASRSAPDQS
jgi:hypothetical protein